MISKETESVVLLHGLARASRSLKKLQSKIQAAGYKVYNLDYPSTRYSLSQQLDYLHQQLSDIK